MPEGGADFKPLQFSTRGLPERERLPMWREEFGRGMVRADIEPSSDLPFHAEATLHPLPGLRMLAVKGSAMRLQRAHAHVADGDDSIGIVVGSQSRTAVSQRGRDAELCDGDAIALLHAEPATVTFARGRHLALVVPRAELASRLTNIDTATMRRIPRRTEALRLLASYLRAVRGQLITTPALCNAVVTHVHDLAALAVTARPLGESSLGAVAAARLSAALDHIAENFDKPELDVAAVAKSQGISPRYLQRLIETTGTSFTARVTELRLQRAFTLLTEARDGEGRISDIALQVGFSDISHFNRLFRSRFGDTPSGVRGHTRRAR